MGWDIYKLLYLFQTHQGDINLCLTLKSLQVEHSVTSLRCNPQSFGEGNG